jgi:two-component system OmpR family response regulator
MRILIVEDEALIRMLVRDVLEEAGFDCQEARDAEEALALLDGVNGWWPDVLVTDYNLGPGPNGADVANEAMLRLPGLGVVHATGNPDCLADRLLGPRERIVAKPFAAADLLAAVTELGVLDPHCRQAGMTGAGYPACQRALAA